MGNLGRQIGNNNGSQDSILRAVAHKVDQTVLRSDLSSPKEKALSEDILAKISEKLNMSEESLGTYVLDLTSKSIDSTLARIVDVVTKSSDASFSKEQLASIKTLLSDLAASKESNTDSVQSTSEVINALQKMFDAQQSAEAAEEPENTQKTTEAPISEDRQLEDKNQTSDDESTDADFESFADDIAKKLDEQQKKNSEALRKKVIEDCTKAFIQPYAKTFEALVNFDLNEVSTKILHEIERASVPDSTTDQLIEGIADQAHGIEAVLQQTNAMLDAQLSKKAEISVEVPLEENIVPEVEVPVEPKAEDIVPEAVQLPIEPQVEQLHLPDVKSIEPTIEAPILAAIPEVESPIERQLNSPVEAIEVEPPEQDVVGLDAIAELESQIQLLDEQIGLAKLEAQVAILDEEIAAANSSLKLLSTSAVEAQLIAANEKLDSVTQAVKETAQGIISSIGNIVEPMLSRMISKVTAPFAVLSDKVSKIGKSLKDGFSNVMTTVTTKTKAIALAPIAAVGKLIIAPFASLSAKISGIGSALKEGLSNVMSSVADGLKTVALAPLKAIGSLFSAINPFKRKKKKKSAEELKLAQMIDKVNNFIDNFFDEMLKHVDVFLDRVLASAKKIVTKLMAHVFMWLLVNVALIGAVLALVIPLIADPLMKVLQPIMDFIESIITKILDFLVPIRDNILIPLGQFILEAMKSVWELVIEPFMRGIGTVAEALGTALGKLIIGIADFMIDTLLPFLRDHFLPVIGAILDSIKILVEALQPWIKPLVDTIMPILLSILDTVGKLFEILKPVILALGKFLAGVFMDILTAVGWTYDNIVKPIVKAIAGFIKFISNIGRALMDKLLEGLSHLPLVGHFFKPSGKKDDISEINDLASAKAEIARLNGKIEQLQSGSEIGALQKDLEEKSKRLVEVDAGTLLTVVDKLDELFKYVKESLTEKINTLLTGQTVEQPAKVEQAVSAEAKATVVKIEQVEPPVQDVTLEFLHSELLTQSESLAMQIEDMTYRVCDVAYILHDHLFDVFMKVADVLFRMQELQTIILADVAKAAAPFFEKAAEAIDIILGEVQAPDEAELAQPTISDSNVTALKSAASTSAEDTAAIQQTAETASVEQSKESKLSKSLIKHLDAMSAVMSSNFAAILEKLDDKPSLLPMPILTTANPNNLATVENI